MDNCTEFLNHWRHSNSCVTRCSLIDNFIELISNEPLWDKDDISYSDYLKDLRRATRQNKVKSLSYEEEQQLIIQKCNGDSVAFERLVISQLGSVITIARKYQNLGLSLNDLISEGNIGLIEAVRKMTPDRFRLYSYAKWYIKSYILNAIDRYGGQIHYPQNIIQNIRKIQKAINTLLLSKGVSPSYDEVEEMCDLDINLIELLMKYIHSEVSIDKLNNYFGGDIFNELKDSVIYPHGYFSNQLTKKQYFESLKIETERALQQLDDRERQILKMSFGIGGIEYDLKEISEKFELTRERSRQIKEKAIRKLKGKRLKSLKQYLE